MADYVNIRLTRIQALAICQAASERVEEATVEGGDWDDTDGQRTARVVQRGCEALRRTATHNTPPSPGGPFLPVKR